MDFFKYKKLDESIYRIEGITGEQMYLITGTEKAALIDTGCGFGNLKELAEQLTDLPITVLITHGHVDHVMGADLFEEVHMNFKDNEILEDHGRMEYRLDYIKTAVDLTDELAKEIVPTPDGSKFQSLEDGQTYDLGGIHLEIYECAGHTPGSVCVLIPEKRILITGDACNWLVFMYLSHALGIRTYESNLREFKEKVDGKYNQVYLSHGNQDGTLDMIDNVIEVCECIQKGEADDIPMGFLDEKGFIAKRVNEDFYREDGVCGNIVYALDKVNE